MGIGYGRDVRQTAKWMDVRTMTDCAIDLLYTWMNVQQLTARCLLWKLGSIRPTRRAMYCKYNVTLGRVHLTVTAVEKQ